MNQKPSFNVRWSRGEQILRDATQNKDAAFTRAERSKLGVEGLLPPAVLTIEQQVAVSTWKRKAAPAKRHKAAAPRGTRKAAAPPTAKQQPKKTKG